MTEKQLLEEVDKAMKLGRKEAYMDMFLIVSDMRVKDNNENLNKLLNILHSKVLSAGAESESQESEEENGNDK